MTDHLIQVDNLYKRFDENQDYVLKDISFKVDKGEVVAIIGPSGTGKSTLLRCLNFLTEPTSGKIRFADSQIDAENYKKEEVLKIRSHSTMVFQSYNLFRNKTVLENIIEAPIMVQKKSKQVATEEALALLDKVNLLDKKDVYPSSLSGGQKQRVGIARALAKNPDVLLFDEPTSALDPELVGEVLLLIKDLAEAGRTMILVTHEIRFARNVADTIFFMDGGNIAAQGSPAEIIDSPSNERLTEFLNVNLELF